MPSNAQLTSLPAHERKFIAIVPDPESEETIGGRLGKGAKVVSSSVRRVAQKSPISVQVRNPRTQEREETEPSPKKRRRKQSMVLVVRRSDLTEMRFPPGHPNDRIVYAVHPVINDRYIPIGDFHQSVFEHKVAEAQKLVRSLGATSVRVEHIQGWRDIAEVETNVSTPILTHPDIERADFKEQSESSRQIIAEMRLEPPGSPFLPDDLSWYPHEPLWVEVAEARLQSGLASFGIDVAYTDDFGVNSNLQIGIRKSGFRLDGAFKEHTSTVWRISGTFSEA